MHDFPTPALACYSTCISNDDVFEEERILVLHSVFILNCLMDYKCRIIYAKQSQPVVLYNCYNYISFKCNRMNNLIFIEDLPDSDPIDEMPRLFDFNNFSPSYDAPNFFQDEIMRDPLSPPIFQQTQTVMPAAVSFPQRPSELPFPQEPVSQLPLSQPTRFYDAFNFMLSNSLNIRINYSGFGLMGSATKKKLTRRRNLKTCKLSATKECPICLEDMKKNSKIPVLACRHEFHKRCLMEWIRKKDQQETESTCPCCRVQICPDC